VPVADYCLDLTASISALLAGLDLVAEVAGELHEPVTCVQGSRPHDEGAQRWPTEPAVIEADVADRRADASKPRPPPVVLLD
jgi:hypothetical protein